MEISDRSMVQSIRMSLSRPFQLLAFEFMCLSLCLYSAIVLGVMYLFFGAFPLVFTEVYQFNLWQVGLSFLGLMVGMIMASASSPLWSHIRSELIQNGTNMGKSEPEFRLPSAMFGSLLVPIGLFVFGWTLRRSIHWIVPIIGSSIYGAG